jgi:hypothetical protein
VSLGLSLHLGLNRVDPSHYGSSLLLRGCHQDARDMANIAREQGFSTQILLDDQATSQVVVRELDRAARALRPGDAFLLTYAGHGAQVPDEHGDEADRLDETWVIFDRMFLDDEIYAALSRFVPGVRILVISDSCHSGSVAREAQVRMLAQSPDFAPFYGGGELVFRTPGPGFGARVVGDHQAEYGATRRSVPRNARDLVNASVIQISACQDDQLAADGAGNGLFTSTLKRAWCAGAFTGNHRGFWQAIDRDMPRTQRPNFLTFGADTGAFERQRPFTVSSLANDSHHNDTSGDTSMYTSSHASDGNWADVRAELEKRFQGRGASGLFEDFASANSRTAVEAFTKATGLILPQAPASDRGWGEVRAATGAPIVRAFWWGFHIEVSSQGLREFISSANPVLDILRAIGPATGPAAPFIAIAAVFLAGVLQLLASLDRGRGVYISMSWFAPGIFVPTTVV